MSVGSSLWAAFTQLVWPARCAACDAFVAEAAVFCDGCEPALGDLGAVCRGCALPPRIPVGAEEANELCPRCRRVPFPFTEARAAFPYGAALARAIVRMKHGGRRDLARRLGRLLAPALAGALAGGGFGPDDLIVPVPLDRKS